MIRLQVRGVVAGWGTSPVLDDVSLDVAAGEFLGILGGNGSGKSTLLAVLSGLLRPREGSVTLDGRRVDGLSAERVAAAGMRLLSQQRRVFPTLTVLENLVSPSLGWGAVNPASVRAAAAEWFERFPALAERRGVPAASLSGGQQQLVALGRVLAVSSKVLLLDEPSAGLSSDAETQVAALLRDRAEQGVAIVLVEQDVRFAARLARRTLQLRGGRLMTG